MTLGQMGALFDGDRRFHDPKRASAPARAEQGTAMDLMMFGSMKVAG